MTAAFFAPKELVLPQKILGLQVSKIFFFTYHYILNKEVFVGKG
jgi:hypothetical protein